MSKIATTLEKSFVSVAPLNEQGFKTFLGSEIKNESEATIRYNLMDFEGDFTSLKFKELNSALIKFKNIAIDSGIFSSKLFVDNNITRANYKLMYLFYDFKLHGDVLTLIGDMDSLEVYNLKPMCVGTFSLTSTNESQTVSEKCLTGNKETKIQTGKTTYDISLNWALKMSEMSLDFLNSSYDSIIQDENGAYSYQSRNVSQEYLFLAQYINKTSTNGFGLGSIVVGTLSGMPLSLSESTSTIDVSANINNTQNPLVINYKMDDYALWIGGSEEVIPVSRKKDN